MRDQQIAKRARARLGRTKPSFDDIIMEATPDYGQNPAHTQRWHRIKNLALLEPDPPKTDVSERRCRAPGCAKLLQRRDKESPMDFARRQTCGRSCGAALGNRRRK